MHQSLVIESTDVATNARSPIGNYIRIHTAQPSILWYHRPLDAAAAAPTYPFIISHRTPYCSAPSIAGTTQVQTLGSAHGPRNNEQY